MTAIRVTSLGPSQLLGAAMIPVPSPWAGAWQSRGFIRRERTVPAPTPGGVPQERVSLAIGGHDSRSSDSPGYIAFDMYTQVTNGLPMPMTPPVSVTSDNQLPVPAIDPRGVASSWSVGYSPRPGMTINYVQRGQRQVVQPKVTTRFPNLLRRRG